MSIFTAFQHKCKVEESQMIQSFQAQESSWRNISKKNVGGKKRTCKIMTNSFP
ncbi:hypothetical protein Mapa_005939 [Marchantia paleacea]|nr:hypothetical protein Mapa_005939 [Marchantia paleacea]